MDGESGQGTRKDCFVLDAGDHEIGSNLTLLASQLDFYLTLFAKRMLSKLKIPHIAGQSLKNWNDMHLTTQSHFYFCWQIKNCV